MKKLVIFDLDGTLLDTTRSMQVCGNYALEALGLPGFPRERYKNFSGGGVEGYVFAVLDAAGDTEHRLFADFWRLHCARNEHLSPEDIEPYEGIPEVLAALKEKGIAFAVLSNKDQSSCDVVVQRYFGTESFTVIRGDREDGIVKPDPAGVFAILEELGLSREECLYVGDTEIDMETGKRAGVDTVAALWGYRPREVLEKFEPEHFISHPSALLSLI